MNLVNLQPDFVVPNRNDAENCDYISCGQDNVILLLFFQYIILKRGPHKTMSAAQREISQIFIYLNLYRLKSHA